MSENPVRRRAPGMSPEERRAMIIAAALPLVAEYGTAVTTSKIARAAGIGEATVFRVFADKDELLDACMAEAMRPDHVVTELASIPLDQPLADRLAEAADALGAHLARMGTVAGALHSSGHRSGERGARPQPGSREASMELIGDAIADLLEPDEAALRLPAAQVSKVFLSLLFTRSTVLPTSQLVEVFLHGAIKEEEPA
ncbi:TetR/AcrR family transcriptional regulator [Nonomuraea aurantiaca]|uniref:TetR/AcrR family transcriptional regulator n=1 Tax=Nonomuraea aurantiaca TaxID=2878562 RepID=UPI001CD9397D|nr:TetR/AcrR family transcriptional regulator [Nonomuraea aurantiaca]MCA2228175.1 TetR/AcrR family transcriptional regulator [Nonomuraea aurantiaca]